MAKVRVQRGNVVLKVEDYEVQRYLQLGYDVTDTQGNVLKEAVPHDLGTLHKYYIEHTAKIAELEQTISNLTDKLIEAEKIAEASKKEVADMKKALDKAKKSAKSTASK